MCFPVYFKVAIAAGVLFLLLQGAAMAQDECPPNCPLKGGGPAATDCLLEFGGVTPTKPGGRIVECSDGDASCDHNSAFGVCGFEVKACLNNADPTLPACGISGIDQVRGRGGPEVRELQDAIASLLPSSQNQCTTPVAVDVPVGPQGGPELGLRHFVLGPHSYFGLNGAPFGAFKGHIDLKAGPVDPNTGTAVVDVAAASGYLEANISIARLCIRPVPTEAAGIISCGRRPGGRTLRLNAGGPFGTDRDGILLQCRPAVNYSTSLTLDHIGTVGRVGTLGENEFTEDDCIAAHATLNPETGVCDFTADDCEDAGGTIVPGSSGVCGGQIMFSQLDEVSSEPGEMILAPLGDLKGFPVEITTQPTTSPCGSGNPTMGMSVAIAVTTMSSKGTVLKNGAVVHEVEPLLGEPFSCTDFTTEKGPGGLVFSAPQVGLMVVGDAVTQFFFTEK